MERDVFAQVQAAVAMALDMEAGPRGAYLRTLEASCPDVYHEVARLLTRADVAETVLTPPIEAMMGPVAGDDDDPLVGRALGAYTIERLIGSGGMGRVYRALQASPARAVAVKVLASRLMGRAAVKRFRQEADVLGRLEHPGICRIYQAETVLLGVDSVPFIAMELVEGVPLMEAVAGTPLEHKMSLFLQVCDAVAYAHQRAVIHRDLKPANVMVVAPADPAPGPGAPPTPRVKVLDFGIARIVEPVAPGTVSPGSTRPDALTDAATMVGTVEYMSPEQLHGRAAEIDTRSDVYALGLILFEMLSGERAFKSPSSWAAAAQRLTNQAAPRLRATSRDLPPELDSIVGKALESDRTRRYQSVAELAEDVRRFLDHRPITARPPTWTYVLSKFARRNRAVSISIVAAVLAIALAVVGVWVSYRRAVDSRDRATLAAARSRASEYVASVQAAAAALRADDVVTARERLNAAPQEHRGWEWGYLEGSLDQSARRLEATTAEDPSIWQIAASPDGTRVAVSSTRWMGIYDLASGRLTVSRESINRATTSIQWTEHGTRLLVGTGWGQRLALLDANTLEILRTGDDTGRELCSAALSPDGAQIAVAAGMPWSTGIADRRVAFLDGATWKQIAEVHTDRTRAEAVSFSPDGSRVLAVGGGDAAVWDARTRDRIAWPGVAGRDVQCAAWAADFKHTGAAVVITAGEDGVIAWDAASLQRRESLGVVEIHAHSIAVGSDSGLLAIGDDTRVRVWDLATGRQIARLRGHGDRVRALTAVPRPDGRTGESPADEFISGGNSHDLRVWRPRNAAVVQKFEGFADAIADGNGPVIAHEDPADASAVLVRRGEMAAVEQRLTSDQHTQSGNRLAVAPDGSWVARLRDNILTSWVLPSGMSVARDIAEGGKPSLLMHACGPHGVLVATRSDTVVLINAPDLHERFRVNAGERIVGLTGLRDDTIAGIATASGRVLTLNAATGEHLGTLVSGVSPDTLAISPDGRRIATLSADKRTIEVWAIASGKRIAAIRTVTYAQSLVLDSTGSRVFVTLHDGSLRVLSLLEQPDPQAPVFAETLQLAGGTSWLFNVSLSPDESSVFCSSVWPTNTCYLWRSPATARRRP